MINKDSYDHSRTYLALIAMIEKAWLVMGPAKLREYLEEIEKKGDITAAEHRSLFTLAIAKMKNNDSPNP